MIITIGGNIGCGKSTVLERLKQHNYSVFNEPIEKWGSWLDLFYSDKPRYSFPFQMKILIDFLYFEKNTADRLLITERSPQDSLHVFSKALVDSKDLSYMEFNLLKEYVDKFGWIPDIYIYLRTSPEVCQERMNSRNRDCESGVALDYLREIHAKYESFSTKLPTVYIVDATQNPDQVFADVTHCIEKYL